MARIIYGSYVVRFPLGGYLSWALQWLVGFQRLGHDVYFVEKSGWPNSCFNPLTDVNSDDCSHGIEMLHTLLARYDLGDRWCYVDAQDRCHGLSRRQLEDLFKSADLFIDTGLYEWLDEAADTKLRVLVDAEPGFTQMDWEEWLAADEKLPEYDYYYTIGRNVGTEKSTAPAAGKQWRPAFDPVVVDLFPYQLPKPDAPFTTVTSWEVHKTVEFEGTVYGQKNVEFEKFMTLPQRTSVPIELAIGGKNVPRERLRDAGWRIRPAEEVTMTFEAFADYIRSSKGEFSVCKNVFVATHSGFFSDRSAAYLASGRPVVMEETGFSDHLPCGRGLFAPRTVEEAAAAIEEINGDYERHSEAAREIAVAYLDAPRVLNNFLRELGI